MLKLAYICLHDSKDNLIPACDWLAVVYFVHDIDKASGWETTALITN